MCFQNQMVCLTSAFAALYWTMLLCCISGTGSNKHVGYTKANYVSILCHDGAVVRLPPRYDAGLRRGEVRVGHACPPRQRLRADAPEPCKRMIHTSSKRTKRMRRRYKLNIASRASVWTSSSHPCRNSLECTVRLDDSES
jgi:hypothetical protein